MGTSLQVLWSELLKKLDIAIDDPILEQSEYQQVFEVVMKEYFDCSVSESMTKCTVYSFSPDEINVLHYACGYVVRKQLKQYEKNHGDVAVQYVASLGEMAVVGENSDLLAYTKQWLELVNPEGLFPLSDEAFRFFIEIELCVRIYLPHHLLRPHSEASSIGLCCHKIYTPPMCY